MNWCRLRLSSVLLLTAIVCVCAAWYSSCRRHSHELRQLNELRIVSELAQDQELILVELEHFRRLQDGGVPALDVSDDARRRLNEVRKKLNAKREKLAQRQRTD